MGSMGSRENCCSDDARPNRGLKQFLGLFRGLLRRWSIFIRSRGVQGDLPNLLPELGGDGLGFGDVGLKQVEGKDAAGDITRREFLSSNSMLLSIM